MQLTRSFLLFSVLSVCLFFSPMSANAWHHHSSHHSYGSSRGNSSAMRAAAASNAANNRIVAAQANLEKVIKAARKQAEKTSGLDEANSDHEQAEKDLQSAKTQVVENLRKSNSEFLQLQQENKALRAQLLKVISAGGDSSEKRDIESKLKSNGFRVEQIETRVVGTDPTIKEIKARQQSAHEAQVAAEERILEAINANPAVKAAQRMLQQATGTSGRMPTRSASSSSSSASSSSSGRTRRYFDSASNGGTASTGGRGYSGANLSKFSNN